MLNNDSIKNRTIFCQDNLDIMRGIDSNCIDMIYLDPPFNKKKKFTAPIGSTAEGASFSDIFREEDVKEEWLLDIKEDYYAVHDLLIAVQTIEGRTSFNFCYLAYMAIRLIECHRILKESGSIYLHCDPTMSHHLKLVLDCIFGEKNFQNEVIIHYVAVGLKAKSNKFHQNTENVLFYAKSKGKHFWKDVYQKYTDPADYRKASNHVWNKKLKKAERKRDEKGMIKYFTVDNFKVDNFIQVPALRGNEKLGYPTQKPIALLERLIQASCPDDGIVLDPFCGCATTCIASERLKRKWVGIDVSIKAYELVKDRMKNDKHLEWDNSFFYKEGMVKFEQVPPKRTDLGEDTRPQKYVYIISNKKFNKGIDKEWKVGIASNVKKRLNSYQTSDPDRGYVLEYSFLTPNFREIEKYIHKIYTSRHEWVREPDMQKIVKDIELWGKG